jgi:hypothetical protein
MVTEGWKNANGSMSSRVRSARRARNIAVYTAPSILFL